MRTRANPVDALLNSATKHWKAQRPHFTIDEVDEELDAAVQLEKEMEGWSQERWQKERDDYHAECVTRAQNLEPAFTLLERQQAICAALMPRYPEDSAERKTLKKLLEHLKTDHARMSREARSQNKVSLRAYRSLRFKHIKAAIRTLSEDLTALREEWAIYNQEQTDLATLANVLDANRTSVTTPA